MAAPPKYGWKARGDRQPSEKRYPFTLPRINQALHVVPFLIRYLIYWIRRFVRKEPMFIDNLRPLQHKPYYGVPCGTIGSGSIGRDFRGGFCKFTLRPGLVEQKVSFVPADQFIVNIRKDGETVYQKVLCAVDCNQNVLKEWDFNFPPVDVDYVGLFPRSWTYYYVKECKVTLTCRQVSPVIPHNYKDSSLPVTVFIWKIVNENDFPLDISITFTFRNGTGDKRWANEGECCSSEFDCGDCVGVDLKHSINGMPCTYSLATDTNDKNKYSRCLRFDPTSCGTKLWNSLFTKGFVDQTELDVDLSSASCTTLVWTVILFIKNFISYLFGTTSTKNSSIITQLGVGLSVQCSVPANSSDKINFCLAWDMPIVSFGAKRRKYRRRYTRFFGNDNQAGPRLCDYALNNVSDWEREIDLWQNPVLSHPYLPDWYKSALFNELYFISDGGSIWMEYDKEWPVDEKQMSEYSIKLMSEYGRFGYLESWEYRMINTYDVHFYSSFALLQLWPHLEHSIQSDFADQIFHGNDKRVQFLMEGYVGPVKLQRRLPHDLGNPADDPWLRPNAYRIHDTGQWRDLNTKFVLLTYRDFLFAVEKDIKMGFLKNNWKMVKAVMTEALDNWDKDSNGLICNSGTADQTYDAWPMYGVSAYCGSLWLASLFATKEMAKFLEFDAEVKFYGELLEKATELYETKLWTGSYYKFDEGSPTSANVIMTDQLIGEWFLNLCHFDKENTLLPDERVKEALKTIYRMNFESFANGQLGAVNGMHKDGTVDISSIESEEVWIGVCYSVSAFMLRKGLISEGFKLASSVFDACYERFGLQYQTPESLSEHKCYRAIGYMRPLAIWSMQWTLEHYHNFPNLNPTLFENVLM